MMLTAYLDDLCKSKFWDSNLTIYSDIPDLTHCFEKTVLEWIPGLLLLLILPLDFWWTNLSVYKNVPWSWLNVSKIVVLTLAMALTMLDFALVLQSPDVIIPDFLAPVINLLIFGTLWMLVLVHKRRGIRASYTPFILSLVLLLCHTPHIYSAVRLLFKHGLDHLHSFTTNIVFYIFLLAFHYLQWFCDKPPTLCKFPPLERPSPETWSSVPRRIGLMWFTSLVRLGSHRPLEASDLYSLDYHNSSRMILPKFQRYWTASQDRVRARVISDSKSSKTKFRHKKKYSASVLPALIKSFGSYFLFGSLLKLISDCLMFANPQFLRLLIQFVSGNDSLWKGFTLAVLMYVMAIIQILHFGNYFLISNFTGMRIATALISAIYNKSLKLSNRARKVRTLGEIVNLMAVDVPSIQSLVLFFNYLWTAPLQVSLALFFLWQLLGPASLAGLGVMILLIPLNGYFVHKAHSLKVKQMKYKDKRIKIINEVLCGIKVLKLYAWELSFENKITKIRQKEIKVLKTAYVFNNISYFVMTLSPYLVSVSSFSVFVLSDEHHILDATTAFVSLSLFNILRVPLSMFAHTLNLLATASVALKRINRYLNSEELDTSSVSHDPSEPDQVVIENGTFSWDETDENETVLRGIDLRVPPGKLVAVVGSVGAGKSSLLYAMLGEMDKISGKVNTKGKIAYAAQQAWIQNATFRENITGHRKFERAWYRKVLKACALDQDIEMLPGMDLTEIGEKGINLSGGQKQRISLARAVYSRADLYLLDDPLSAVDAHVGKHIFEHVISPIGLLRDTTRILVTHGVSFLPLVDLIVVMKDGEISESGTYRELLESKGDFADFLFQHLEDIDGTALREELIKYESLKNRFMQAKSEEHLKSKATKSRSTISSESSASSLYREARRKSPKLITAEEQDTGNVKFGVFIYYLRAIGILMSSGAVCGIIIYQVFVVSTNLWLARWSSDNTAAANGTQDTHKTHLYLGVYAALGVFQAVSNVVSNVTLSLGCLLAAAFVHFAMLTRVLRAPMSYFDTTPLGRILNRFSHDIDVCDNLLTFNLQQFLNLSVQTIAIIGVITFTTPPFIIAVVPIFLINFYFQRLYVSTSRELKRLESTARSPIYSHFSETLQGAPSIRAYGLQEQFIADSEKRVDAYQTCAYPSIIAARWLAYRLELFGNLIIFFAALFAVLSRHTLKAGSAGLSITYAMQVIASLNFFTRMSADVETNLVSVERVKEYTEINQEAPWRVEPEPDPSWPSEGKIEFINYKIRYRESLDLVLNGVTFTINPGEKVGIVGRTGAGKSSLTLALFRIVEAVSGVIKIDGVNIATVGLHSLRSRLTIIPQDPVLISGTLRFNLDPFNRASDETLWESLELSNLKTYIKSLPLGLDHQITEGGENLSVGQKQLVCLARALLRKTKILILDEATAAVDLDTDDTIQETIRSEFENCTVLTIAHRLNTIMDYDRILVLEQGQVAEFDTPKRLLQNPYSIFHSMSKDAGLVHDAPT